MLKLAIKSERAYSVLSQVPWIAKPFVLRLDSFPTITSDTLAIRLYGEFLVFDGTTKETRPNRFRDVDTLTLEHLKTLIRPTIHDVAVSTGITSVELYHKLVAAGLEFEFFVSDKFARYYASGRWLTTITDTQDRLVAAYVLGALADDRLPWRWILSKLLFRWVRSRRSHASPARREILMYHPTLRQLLGEQQIRELACDILSRPAPMPCSFVRCMNLLNRAYFPDPVLRRALDNLQASVTNGGILQVGRTLTGGGNAVSFYRRVDDRLRWLQDLNGGSELRQLLETLG